MALFLILLFSGLIIYYATRSSKKPAYGGYTEAELLQQEKNEEEKKLRLIQKRKDFHKKYHEGFVKATLDHYPKFVFIDFETTDLPSDYTVPSKQRLIEYPYIVQAGIIVFNEKAELIDEYSAIIKVPEDAIFSPEAVRIHKISKKACLENGCSINLMLSFIQKYLSGSTCVIAHNVKFDHLMLQIEAKRHGVKLPKYRKYCTMEETVEIVKIWHHSYRKYKYPKLKELVDHTFFEGTNVQNAINLHDANVDVRLCAMCFFHLELHKEILVPE